MIFSAFATLTVHTTNISKLSTFGSDAVPATLYKMNVTINPDGTVTNGSAITQNGNLYTLNGNLNGTLTILANDTIFNGAGYTIDANGSSNAVYVDYAKNVDIANFTAVNASYGVNITDSNSIQAENITTYSISIIGFSVNESSHVSLSWSNITGGMDGVDAVWSSYINLGNNTIVGTSDCGFYPYASQHLQSFNDNFSGQYYGVYLYLSDDLAFTYDNFSDIEYGAYISCSNSVYIEYSNLSDDSSASVYAEGSGVVNLSYDYINDSGTSAYAVELDYENAPISLFHDFIYAEYAVYFDDLSYGATVTYSTLITEEGFYTEYQLDSLVLSHDHFTVSSELVDINGNYAVSNISIYDSVINGISSYTYGLDLYAYSCSDVTIVGNIFNNVYYPVDAYAYPIADSTVANNTFINSSISVEFEYCANISITGNRFLNTTDEAVEVWDSVDTFVTNNYFNETGSYAIDVGYNAGDLIISGNEIYNVTGTQAEAINVESSTSAQIYDNLIVNSVSNYEGIYVDYLDSGNIFDNHVYSYKYSLDIEDSTSVNVYNNYVFNASCGIYLSDISGGAVFSNIVENSTNTALYVYSVWTTSIYANTFSNVTGDMLYVVYSGGATFFHNNFLNGSTINTYFSSNDYLFWNEASPIDGNYWSNYSGTGTYVVNGSNVDYLPLQHEWNAYEITFKETGLPVGTVWSATLGNTTIQGMGSEIVFSPSAAQQIQESYSVGAVAGYSLSASSGSITFNETSQTIQVVFTQTTYQVGFSESGLPAGTTWNVVVTDSTGSSTSHSGSGQISFSLPNGTYTYTILSIPGYGSTLHGTVTVSASTQSVSVEFTVISYTVTISETGLSSGTTWTFTLGGKQYSSNTTTTTVVLSAGTYNLTVSTPSGYTVGAPSSIDVDYNNVTANVAFAHNSTTPSGAMLGLVAGAGAVIGVVAAALGTMFYTGTGVFANMKKRKGN